MHARRCRGLGLKRLVRLTGGVGIVGVLCGLSASATPAGDSATNAMTNDGRMMERFMAFLRSRGTTMDTLDRANRFTLQSCQLTFASDPPTRFPSTRCPETYRFL